MDERSAPEPHHRVRSTTKVLSAISEKVTQLQKVGLQLSDRRLLKKGRLSAAWDESDRGGSRWRKKRARDGYTAIQRLNEHLFLAVILTVGPTECGTAAFDSVVEHFRGLQDYKSFHLDLSPDDKGFFESTAAEQGLSGTRGYISFMKALFPQVEERQIQFLYSHIPLDKIDKLFEIMRNGSERSHMWTEERARQENTSSFVTGLIPIGEKDCVFSIVVGRDDMMQGLRQLGLSQVKLS